MYTHMLTPLGPGLTDALRHSSPGSDGSAHPVDAIEADRTDVGPPMFEGRHGMRTQAMLLAADRMIAAKTEISNDADVGGFTGRVWVLVATRSGRPIAKVFPVSKETGDQVGWRAVGRAAAPASGTETGNRQCFWTARIPEQLSDEVFADVTRLEIVHSWKPRSLVNDTIDEAIRDQKTVDEIVTAVADAPCS